MSPNLFALALIIPELEVFIQTQTSKSTEMLTLLQNKIDNLLLPGLYYCCLQHPAPLCTPSPVEAYTTVLGLPDLIPLLVAGLAPA